MYLPVKMVGHTEKRWNSVFKTFNMRNKFKFTPAPDGENDIVWLKKGLDYIVSHIKEGSQPTDRIGFTFNSSKFHHGEGYIAFRPASEVNSETIFHVVGGFMESNRDTQSSWSDTFELNVTRVSLPSGELEQGPSSNSRTYESVLKRREILPDGETQQSPSPNTRTHETFLKRMESRSTVKIGQGPSSSNSSTYESFLKHCKEHRSIVCINNADNLSLPKAIVVGKALAKRDPDYELIRKDRKGRQSQKAKLLLNKAEVVIPDWGAGIKEILKICSQLEKYNLHVYDYSPDGSKEMFEWFSPDTDLYINLLHCNGHYNLISKITTIKRK